MITLIFKLIITFGYVNLKTESGMTKTTGAYIVMIAGLILLMWTFSELDFNNLGKGPFTGIVSNVLLILAMIVSIRDLKKNKQ